MLNVQITHASHEKKVSAKAKHLAEYMQHKQNEIGLFIGPEKCRDQVLKYPSLEFVSTDHIFDTLTADPDYKRMLEKMIGIKKQITNDPLQQH